MTTWETARCADARKVWEWVVLKPGGRELTVQKTAIARRMRFWKRGGKADFYAVDRVLHAIGRHPCELPEDVWLDIGTNASLPKLRRAA